MKFSLENTKIGVIGLGYVGLPLALALARKFPAVGYDRSSHKIELLKKGIDPTDENLEEEIKNSRLVFSDSPEVLKEANFLIVGVPTPVNENRTPDLTCLESACQTIGEVIKPGTVIVFESTVYPGLTEEICAPIIEKVSGLKRGEGFFLGYSPERMNPGDKERSVTKICKVVSGENHEVLEYVASVYGSVVEAGIFKAKSIMIAEAAKVIENTQRDLNIALMNELSIIFDKLGIRTKDVLDAAGTKWNFLKFTPGLVGGHCIGVDPYYLTAKAEQLGYNPQVILAGRRINDSMGQFTAQKVIKLLIQNEKPVKGARVGILGLTFKENVTDIRNSRVPDIVKELNEFGIQPLVYDPLANHEAAYEEYRVSISRFEELHNLDALILAVPHDEIKELGVSKLVTLINRGGVFADLKSIYSPSEFENLEITYWSL